MTATAETAGCPHYGPLLALEPDAIGCPYPYFSRMRDETPVEWVDELGCYAVTRYDDILEIVRDTDRFSSRMPTGPKAMNDTLAVVQELIAEREDIREVLASNLGIQSAAVLLTADPPAHDRQRALVSRAFTPRRVRALEPRIREVADSLVDAFIDRGECEFISEFAVGLPLTIIAECLGVATDDMPSFKRWSDDFVAAIGNHRLTKDRLADMLTSQVEFFEYFTHKIEQVRAEPQDDLISDVVHAEIEGQEPLQTIEMLAMFSQFLVAGNETTTKLLGSMLLLLLRNPEVARALRDDPGRIPQMVEEALRLEAPVQGLFRMANVDTEIGGVGIPAGSSLWLVYASGNRDRDEFPDPDQLDLDRDNSRLHLSFGNGTHYCLGAALSRAEARIGLETILERLEDIELATADVEYEESYALHGLKRLPIRFRARADRPG